MNHLQEIISRNLKNLRKSKGWSLDKTSENTGISKAMLGQIERKESSPTISTLWKIATGFKVSFSSLISDAYCPQTKIIDENTPKQIHPEDDKLLVTSIFPFDPELSFEIFILNLLPNCSHISSPHEDNVTEHIIVTKGKMEVLIDSTWKSLGVHDAIKFKANSVHGYRNLSDEEAICHNIIYYGQ